MTEPLKRRLFKAEREKFGRGPRARRVVDGVDLGPELLPMEILSALRAEYDDGELLEALFLGAERLARDLGPDPVKPDAPVLGDLTRDDRLLALQQAREVTRARFEAWRRRLRHMTWLELRVLLIGLRELAGSKVQ